MVKPAGSPASCGDQPEHEGVPEAADRLADVLRSPPWPKARSTPWSASVLSSARRFSGPGAARTSCYRLGPVPLMACSGPGPNGGVQGWRTTIRPASVRQQRLECPHTSSWFRQPGVRPAPRWLVTDVAALHACYLTRREDASGQRPRSIQFTCHDFQIAPVNNQQRENILLQSNTHCLKMFDGLLSLTSYLPQV